MADNLTTQTAALATVPTASAIATDDVGGVHFQKVKLIDGTADSSAAIPGDATNGLDVDVTRSALPTGAATAANQTTEIGHLATLAGGVSGTEYQVDIVTAPTLTVQATNLDIRDLSSASDSVSAVVTSSALPTGASTLAEQQTQTTHLATIAGDTTDIEAAVELLDDTVFVDDAAFTVGTSKVLATGGQAVAHGTNPDAADAGDAGIMVMNRHRVQWVIGGHPNIITAVYNTTGAQTDDPVVAVISTGAKIAVTQIMATLDEATTVGVAIRIGFGTANVPALGASGADGVAGLLAYHPGLVPGSIFTRGDGSAVIGIGADNEDLRITCEAPTSGTLGITVSYYTIES